MNKKLCTIVLSCISVSCLFGCHSMGFSVDNTGYSIAMQSNKAISQAENYTTSQAENLQDTQEVQDIFVIQAKLYSYNEKQHCGVLLDSNGELWQFENMYLYDTDYIITYGYDFDLISLQYNNMIVYFTN